MKPETMSSKTAAEQLAEKEIQDAWIVADQSIVDRSDERRAFVKGYMAGQESSRWIPVSERLPEDGLDVLVFTKYKYRGVGCILEGYWYLTIAPETDQEDGVVTHWQPLPEPPNT